MDRLTLFASIATIVAGAVSLIHLVYFPFRLRSKGRTKADINWDSRLGVSTEAKEKC